jgi:tetratricopeptide (TPR) repeat protein
MDSTWVGGYAAYANSYLFSEPKDFKKAEEYALKEVALAPTSQGAEITLGDCYRAQNDLNKAKDAYAKAITLDPSSAEAYYKEGHTNTFLGNYDEARKNYTDAGSHDESMQPAYSVIAYTYLYAGDPVTALKMLMEYASKADSSGQSQEKINNDKLNYWSDCERIAMHTGDAAMLKECLEKTDPLNAELTASIGTPEATQLNDANNLYWQAIVATLQGNYDEAKTKAEANKTAVASINDPNKLDQYHFALGFIAMKEKKYSDAVGHFAETNQNSVYNNYWLAMANEAAGNKDKADALYKSIAVYNFNGVDYALIRGEVLKKVTPTT